jgi:hypothetical protein
VAHRTQITLTNEQYVLLRQRSSRSGASISELLRRAVDSTYAAADDSSRQATGAPGDDPRVRREAARRGITPEQLVADAVARELGEPTSADRAAALARIASAGVPRLDPDELRALIDERDE